MNANLLSSNRHSVVKCNNGRLKTIIIICPSSLPSTEKKEIISDQPAPAGSCFDLLESRHFGVVVA